MRSEECVVRIGPGNWLGIRVVRRGRRRGGGAPTSRQPPPAPDIPAPDSRSRCVDGEDQRPGSGWTLANDQFPELSHNYHPNCRQLNFLAPRPSISSSAARPRRFSTDTNIYSSNITTGGVKRKKYTMNVISMGQTTCDKCHNFFIDWNVIIICDKRNCKCTRLDCLFLCHNSNCIWSCMTEVPSRSNSGPDCFGFQKMYISKLW